MTRLAAPIIMAATSVTATETAMQLLERQSIGLPAAIGIASVVGGAAWWLATKFRAIDDKLDAINARFSGLPCVNKTQCRTRKKRI